ncbi:MAG: hypothetical protein RLZZ631_589 [Cyanobacteriota bacterium]
MTALELEEVTPDESIADLEKRWGISRNALKARAKALGVELIRKGPTLTVWPGDRIAEADRLDAHLKAGGAMAGFPGFAGGDSQPSVTPHGRSAGSQLAVMGKVDPMLALAEAMAKAMPQPAVDPLARARGLAEAADNALVLCNEDLAALVGQGVSGWTDGTERFGYRFRRHQQGRQVLWVVERAVAVTGKLAAVSGRAKRVGFATPEPDVIEARVEVLSTGAALFASNRIG